MDEKKLSALPAAGALTGDEIIPIVQGGVTSRTTVADVAAEAGGGGGGSGPKVYRALLSQSGTDAPVATVLENTLGGVPVWSYSDVGSYLLSLAGAFIDVKTFVIVGNSNQQGFFWAESWSSPDQLAIITGLTNGNLQDNLLYLTPVEILVYP